MIEKKDILKMIQHIAKRSGGKVDTRLIHPARDWFIVLSFSVTVLLVGGAYVGFLLFQKQQEDFSNYTVEIEAVRYKGDRIREVLDIYRLKEVQFEILRKNRVVDTTSVQPRNGVSDAADDNAGTAEIPDIEVN